jgi:DNA-binding MarR family transcriptional regulator
MPYLDPANHQLPFQSGSETSRDAAVKAQRFVGKQGADVLHFLEWAGDCGATQREIAEALHIGRPSVCARVRALEQCGDVVKTPARRQNCAVYCYRGPR